MEIQKQLHLIKLLARILETNAPPNMTSVSIGFQNKLNVVSNENNTNEKNKHNWQNKCLS